MVEDCDVVAGRAVHWPLLRSDVVRGRQLQRLRCESAFEQKSLISNLFVSRRPVRAVSELPIIFVLSAKKSRNFMTGFT